ncbi:uncharacterized protein BJ171DRAFT_635356 [Polychytrium aggregatum]|uniref:uncharacterized protein n=1 Tax=Polychytrium aggregatum TaxID=110093 RepID=UPI0022FF122B|nr:uncharacterized protein BJ171DRAFT_635356 [Polychytrium aggregatum]KAI9193728.1 hypothetical protein BJ171DRAFT_635356 [Polychytrium aggregatum]
MQLFQDGTSDHIGKLANACESPAGKSTLAEFIDSHTGAPGDAPMDRHHEDPTSVCKPGQLDTGELDMYTLGNMPAWKAQIYICLYHHTESVQGRVYHCVSLLILWLSLAGFCVSTVNHVMAIPFMPTLILAIDVTATVAFIVELVLFILVATEHRRSWGWARLVDALAIVPFIGELAGSASMRMDPFKYCYGPQSPNPIRILRVCRIFKLFQKSTKLGILVQAMYNSREGILALFYVLPLIIIFFGSLVFFAEQIGEYYRDGVWYYQPAAGVSGIGQFQSIPSTFWFMMVTLTTLSHCAESCGWILWMGPRYGDVTPKTATGKLAAIGAMLASMFIVAFPLTMITTQYAVIVRQFNQRRRREGKWIRQLEEFRRQRILACSSPEVAPQPLDRALRPEGDAPVQVISNDQPVSGWLKQQRLDIPGRNPESLAPGGLDEPSLTARPSASVQISISTPGDMDRERPAPLLATTSWKDRFPDFFEGSTSKLSFNLDIFETDQSESSPSMVQRPSESQSCWTSTQLLGIDASSELSGFDAQRQDDILLDVPAKSIPDHCTDRVSAISMPTELGYASRDLWETLVHQPASTDNTSSAL